jgi:hypothetical protein
MVVFKTQKLFLDQSGHSTRLFQPILFLLAPSVRCVVYGTYHAYVVGVVPTVPTYIST